MGEENIMLQPRDTLHLLRIALADVVASLGEIPKYADRYANLGALLDLLNKVTAQGKDRPGAFHHLENSRLFCNTVSSYIYNQSSAYCLGCVDHPEPEKRQSFIKQKEKLFDEARKGLGVDEKDVYSLAYSCPNLITVDEVTYYYGGAGRTCSDSHMTKIFSKMEDAERFAFNYLLDHTPKMNYIEIFEALAHGKHTEKLFPDGPEILKEYFKSSENWIGSSVFFEWLKKSGVTLEEFWEDFSDITAENDWLRPYLIMSCNGEERGICHNQLNFDPGHGYRWDIRPYSFYARLCRLTNRV